MESLANIYENADTFLDHVINETGDNKEKAENLALKLLSLEGYKDYQDYYNSYLKFQPNGIKYSNPTGYHKQNIRNMFNDWFRARRISFHTVPPELGPFGVEPSINWELLSNYLPKSSNPTKKLKSGHNYSNLSKYCPDVIRIYEYNPPEPEPEPESKSKSVFGIFFLYLANFISEIMKDDDDTSLPNRPRGHYYIYVLVKENDKYYLYLAGPCSDKECHTIISECNSSLKEALNDLPPHIAVMLKENTYMRNKMFVRLDISHSDIYEGKGEIIMGGELYRGSGNDQWVINNESGHLLPGPIEGEVQTVLEMICSDSFGCMPKFENFNKGSNRKKKKRKNNKKTKRRKPRSKVKSKKVKKKDKKNN
tara:strand:+ start:406 stop:1503 length:1098 start_codon:yes stop_codon:yes gene_type:complete